jgi:hypothetical protein
MIEVAITSMQEALAADGNEVPLGSTLFERDPLELPGQRGSAEAPSPGPATEVPEVVRSGEPPPLT